MEKFLHIYLLISIIFSTLFVVLGSKKSFVSLNSTDIIEAKKRFLSFDITKLPNPPMPSYTFAIYNRDLFEKSKFKDYDSLLKNKIARSQARLDHLSSFLRNGNVMGANGSHESKRDGEGVLESTSAYNFAGEHVGVFTIGSQNLRSYLLLDTGSDLVWWQCKPCRTKNSCYEQKNSPIYVSTDSTTYRNIDCVAESGLCPAPNNPSYRCYIHSDKTCRYDYGYAGGHITRGWIAEEVITFVKDQSQTKVLFGCSKDQTTAVEFFSGEYSGIAGLGRRSKGVGYSLPSQFKSDIMAICLPRIYSVEPGSLTFHTMPFNRETHTELVPNSVFNHFYYLNLYKVFVNDHEIPVDPSYWKFKRDKSGGILLDTGATFTIFPRDYYIIFREIYRGEAQNFQMVDTPVHPFDTCYKVDHSQVEKLPFVTLYFGVISPDKSLILNQDPQVLLQVGELYCLAFLPSDRETATLGAHQLQGIGLTFDTRAGILSFDHNACIVD